MAARVIEGAVVGGAQAVAVGVLGAEAVVAVTVAQRRQTGGGVVDAGQSGAQPGAFIGGDGPLVEVLAPGAAVGEDVGHYHGVRGGQEGQDLREQVGHQTVVEGQGPVLDGDQCRVGGDVRKAGEAVAADLDDHAAPVAGHAEDVADVAAGARLYAGGAPGVQAARGEGWTQVRAQERAQAGGRGVLGGRRSGHHGAPRAVSGRSAGETARWKSSTTGAVGRPSLAARRAIDR